LLSYQDCDDRYWRDDPFAIRRSRFANLDRQWQGTVTALAANTHAAAFPVNIVQLEKGDFASAQTQSRKQQQYGVIRTANRTSTVAVCQDSLHVIRLNRARDRGHRPIGDRGNCGGKIERDVAAVACIIEK
jgi:hypothetical protein